MPRDLSSASRTCLAFTPDREDVMRRESERERERKREGESDGRGIGQGRATPRARPAPAMVTPVIRPDSKN